VTTVVRHLWAGGKPMKALTQRLGNVDDVLSVGTLGLIRAAELWDPEIGPFRAYAYTCVRRTILAGAAVAGVIAVPKIVSEKNQERAYRAHHQTGIVAEALRAEAQEEEDHPHALLDAMAQAIAKMSRKDQQLLQKRLDGESYADIATEEHVTKTAIGFRLSRIYKRLRKVLTKPGGGSKPEW
jgi:RNA polymerase sigma factor (sigma-70 family)